MRSSRSSHLRTAALILLAAACTTESPAPALITEPDVALDVSTTAVALTPVWVRDTGGVSVAVDASDNVYTARWDYNPAGDIYLAKHDVNGTLLWEVRYDNTDNTKHEAATWVATDPSGNVFVSGTIRSGYSNPVNANSLLMKFAPNGALLWRRVYGNTFDGSSVRKVLVDGSGNAYAFGLGVAPDGMRTSIRKFAPDGTTLWTWFDFSGIGGPLNVKFGADGNLVVVGRAMYGSINGYTKVSTSGTTMWSIPGISSLSAGDVAGDAQGNSYLVNGNYGGTGSFLRKVGPTGALIWERPHVMTAFRVEVGTDLAPVISGYPGGVGAAFAKFDAAGNHLWTNLDADGPNIGLLAHAMMRLDATNNAYLAAGNMSQMGMVKVLAATGATEWTALVPYGYSADFAFGQGNRLFLTGGSVVRLDQPGSPPPPPTNTAPAISIAAGSATTIPVGATFSLQAAVVDPDAGDGPWSYNARWGNGQTNGTWATPGTHTLTRVYPRAGKYSVRVIVTDARGARDTSNVIKVTVR